MKHYYIFLFLFTVLIATVSCTRENDINSPDTPSSDIYITDSVRYEGDKMTAYNFVYPSKDPYGNPVVLSATITMGDSVKNNLSALGLALYNHFTIYRADECPTKGKLDIQRLLARSRLITISPDYYGLGISEKYHQAYCISSANAQSSVDALLAAKKLLTRMGYKWDDRLFNLGYSQGAHTSMGVVRLVDTKYPDIHITQTYAGAGSYDIPETYRQFISYTLAGMPSTVISVLLAYNEYAQLGIPREEMFVEPVLSHIDEWILSKRYKREEIDSLIGTQTLTGYIAPTLLDTNTSVSQKVISALDNDNLCKNWTPRRDEKIYLFHNTQDITVPVENTTNLYRYLTSMGVSGTEIDTADYGSSPLLPAHEMGAMFFMKGCVDRMSAIMGVAPWSIF